jgi:membrane protein implicated in regulation of membrane protease activity
VVNESTLWWVIAGVLVAVELATGTFYLLMLALGCVAGALAAHAGLPESIQVALAAIVGGLCAGGWYARRRKALAQAAANPMAAQDDPTLSLDLGQTVHVNTWHSDGTAQVQYRGASWLARLNTPLQPPLLPDPGTYRIRAMQGNQLLLEKA